MPALARTLASITALRMLATVAPASQSASESVSKEMMSLLLRGPGLSLGDNFDLQRGSAPKTFPMELLPPGSQVGVTGTTDRGTVVVGFVPTPTESSRSSEVARLQKLGWIHQGSPTAGLPTGADASLSFCRGPEFAVVAALPRSAGGSLVRVSVTRETNRSCGPAQYRDVMADVKVPSLYPPPGVRSYNNQSLPGADVSYYAAQLETTKPVRELAAYYVGQIRAAGWRLASDSLETNSLELAVVRATSKSASGSDVTALLTIMAIGERVDLQLRIVRNRPPTPSSSHKHQPQTGR